MKEDIKKGWHEYLTGVKDGLPVGIAYLAVSFTFGLQVVNAKLPWWLGPLISLTNFTSAGQFAGLQMMVVSSMLFEIFFAVFVINSRYMLMSLSVSQQLDGKLGTGKRMVMSFFMSDEIFALATLKGKNLTFAYFMGIALSPYVGWSTGTLTGCLVGNLLPPSLQAAMGIALYCMFIAIIIPPARKSKPILFCIAVATALSCGLYYIPYLNRISFGFSVIISSVAASALTALIFPHKEEGTEQSDDKNVKAEEDNDNKESATAEKAPVAEEGEQ